MLPISLEGPARLREAAQQQQQDMASERKVAPTAMERGFEDDEEGKGGGCCGCDIFCRQFCALVRKNFLTKRRSKCQLIIELIVPALLMLLIGAIKSAIEVEVFDEVVPTLDTPVPMYGDLESQLSFPNVLCFDNNMFLRCSCHQSVDVIDSPSDYLIGQPVNATGAAIWSTLHAGSSWAVFCFQAATAVSVGNTASTGDFACALTKFVRNGCTVENEGFEVDFTSQGWTDFGVPLLDDACGAGEFSLDPNATEYLSILSEGVALLQDEVDYVIPADSIETVCQTLFFAVMSEEEGSDSSADATAFHEYVTGLYPDTEDRWLLYSSESELIDIIGEGDYSREISDDLPGFAAGIVFSSGSPSWEYTIRANFTKAGSDVDSYWMVNVPSTSQTTENNCKSPTGCPDDSTGRSVYPWTSTYQHSGVLMLQQLVDSWIMTQEGADNVEIAQVRLADFPSPEYEDSGFWTNIGFMFAIFVVVSVLYPVSNVIGSLVKEKELRIKEGLRMMGLTGTAHTASWVFHFVCLFFVISVLMTIASGSLFENSDLGLVFLYFFLFFMATTAFCFFISSFFSRAKTASTVGTMVFFVALFPYFALFNSDIEPGARRAGCLLPPTCLALGTLAFSEYEDSGEGVTASTTGTSEDGFTFNDVLSMLFLDILVFSALAWYTEHVVPSEWGTHQKPWFVFTKRYWFPGATSRDAMEGSKKVLDHDESDNRDSVEAVSNELRMQVAAGQCVAMRGFTKEYKNSTGGSKIAVDKLDLTMYCGQITALLGHNGAGKTTTIAMLTGMVPVTSGVAFVSGRNVDGDMVNIRQTLGVCPQHDILYPDLTVREHLRMYGVLKGVKSGEIVSVIQATLADVGLTEKENELTKTLSGGQKRKLSVGIALIGGSRVVFLDEPTSGMDPHSRRFTWDLIRKNREGRVIVLTTHFMDEADLLGDRIAIMADGALRCCGSSIFLKNHYGVGYNLTIVRNVGGESEFAPALIQDGKVDDDVDERGINSTQAQEEGVRPIKKLVRSHVKAATLLSNVGAEISFQLPHDASSAFKGMLSEIDSRKRELDINSYGMSVTTLEEVFLRVANGTADVADRKTIAGISLKRQSSESMNRQASQSSTMEMAEMTLTKKHKDKGIDRDRNLFGAHMMALLKKRLLTFKRDKKMWAFIVIMPAVFVLIGVIILITTSTTNEPSLLITPTDYNNGAGAPLPYAANSCSASAGTCDPATLLALIGDPDSIEAFSLDLNSTSDADEAVGELNAELLATANSYGEKVYGAFSFREADTDALVFDYTIHANYSALHSVPIYINQINTAVLRLATGDDTLSIAVNMHPFPSTTYQGNIESGIDSFNTTLFILLAFSFVPAAWIAYIVREKETKCKHQQVVSGVSLDAYWVSSYVWDFVSLIIPVGFTLIIVAAADVEALISGEAAGATILLFLLYGLSMPSYTYLWSFFFSSYSTAQNTFLFMNWIFGLIAPLAVTIMSFFTGTVNDVGRGLSYILSLCPQFALASGLLNLGFVDLFGFIDDESYGVFDLRITGISLIYMGVCAVLYFLLLLVMERASAGGGVLSGMCGKMKVGRSLKKLTPKQLGDEDEIDPDVSREAQRVTSGGADHDVVKIQNLGKVYPVSTGAKVAVKSTSLGIPRGECFGLLGINGAGKSTTLAILSGEVPPTTGSAYLSGFDVGKNPEHVHRLVGYCPQFDALFETLTAREHLRLYAAIKGIASDKIEEAVEEKVEEMGLRQYVDRPAGGFSGGNKRKLSVAIAMIGDPQIVFLDEPSTGMDPMARRFMWNVIMRIVTENKECAMVLTTHSMEECEALCQRIGIMVGGRLKCLGSSQHLKTRFGNGFQLEARASTVTQEEVDNMLATIAPATNGQGILQDAVMGPALDAAHAGDLAAEITAEGRGANMYHSLLHHRTVVARDFAHWICVEKKCTRVIDFVKESFSGANLREKQNAKMRFELPQQENMTLADMFGFIEDNRVNLAMGEYSLSQTSLEQIFNGFASQQEEELGRAAGMT